MLSACRDIDETIAQALVLAREAQAIIDAIHSAGFDMDSVMEAIGQLTNRLTRESGDIWAVMDVLYASFDVAGYEDDETAIFKAASMDEETFTLMIGE